MEKAKILIESFKIVNKLSVFIKEIAHIQLKNKKLSGSEVTFDRLAWTDPFELTLFSLLAENLILTTYIVEIEKCNKDNNLNSVGINWCCRKKVFPY